MRQGRVGGGTGRWEILKKKKKDKLSLLKWADPSGMIRAVEPTRTEQKNRSKG